MLGTFCMRIISALHKFHKGLFFLYGDSNFGFLMGGFSFILLFSIWTFSVPTKLEHLDWDEGYLEQVKWSERRGKVYLVVYSKKYNKRRSFNSHSLINEWYLKKQVENESYYNREVKIGSYVQWYERFIEAPTAGMHIYSLTYNGEKLLDFNDSLSKALERKPFITMVLTLIALSINIPYLYYLMLIGAVRYGKLKSKPD